MSTSSSNNSTSPAATSAASPPGILGLFIFFITVSTVFLITYFYWVVKVRRLPTEYYVDWIYDDVRYLGGLGHKYGKQ
ncbi:hypothetical protein DXG01_005265 [Tephrocybe rancida]|nr:hypothetical protein DXG01_005265 [Tephrocybe rancida]